MYVYTGSRKSAYRSGRVVWSERAGHIQQDVLAAQQISPWERPGNQP